MANHHIWDSTTISLNKAGFRTLAYDHPGHGATSAPTPSQSFSFDDLTSHLHTILSRTTSRNSMTAHPFAIIGCSMGGVLAIRYALLHPDPAMRIMCCDAPGLTSLESAKPLWRDRIAQFRAEGVERLAQTTVDRWFPDPVAPGVKAAALEQTRTCQLEGYRVCAEGITSYDYDGMLGDVRGKVVILRGENDSSVGPKSVLMDVARRVAGARYVELKDAGHIPPMHRPAEFEQAVLHFLADV